DAERQAGRRRKARGATVGGALLVALCALAGGSWLSAGDPGALVLLAPPPAGPTTTVDERPDPPPAAPTTIDEMGADRSAEEPPSSQVIEEARSTISAQRAAGWVPYGGAPAIPDTSVPTEAWATNAFPDPVLRRTPIY